MKTHNLQNDPLESPTLHSQPILPLRLSTMARTELREILIREAGEEVIDRMTEDDLDHFGFFLLTVAAEGLKLKARIGL